MHSDIDSTKVKHPFMGRIRQADNSSVGSTEDEITNRCIFSSDHTIYYMRQSETSHFNNEVRPSLNLKTSHLNIVDMYVPLSTTETGVPKYLHELYNTIYTSPWASWTDQVKPAREPFSL